MANLTPEDFHICEDSQPVSVLESKQTILQPEVAAIHYTLLPVDMSGSVVDSRDMPALIQAAASFSENSDAGVDGAAVAQRHQGRLTPSKPEQFWLPLPVRRGRGPEFSSTAVKSDS